MNNICISIIYQGMLLTGHAEPIETSEDAFPSRLKVYIKGWYIGNLSYHEKKWSMDQPIDQRFIDSLGAYIYLHINAIKKAMNCHC